MFTDYEKWPVRYHLDILAHTTSWRSKENIKIIADSVAKMMKTDRPELINLGASSWVGRPLGPLGVFPSQGLTVKVTCGLPSPMNIHLPNRAEVYQMEYIEWFARCGIVQYIPDLQDVVNDILNSVDNDGICRAPVLEGKDWGPYYGMKLEVDWKTKIRKACDITFRALLIAHYASIGI